MKDRTSLERTVALTKRILAVPKAELDDRVRKHAKRTRRRRKPA